jgi:putative ABC transport system permease protein
MFKNYLISLYRNIVRNRFYSILNIVGLSVGIASAIFILLFVRDEMSYDKHHEKHNRIYRIESDFFVNGKADQFAIVPLPMGPALQIEFPEIESFVRLSDVGNTLFRYDQKEYYEEHFYMADSTVFNIFTHEFILGNPKNCLTEPRTIVITKKIAAKYFGNENPMGEIMTSGRGTNYQVTGVIENLPGNSHLKFDALISTATMAAESGEDEFNSMEPVRFWNIGVYTYLLMKENSSVESIHEKFQPFYDKYMKPVGDQFNASFKLMSTPLADTHFREGLGSEQPTGNKAYVLIFSAVAIFILIIAAINYMNMATARSAKRAKEVGIRKVLGAFNKQLIRQFLSESLVLAFVALMIAILMVAILLPDFNELADKTLSFSIVDNPLIYIEIILITIIVGLVSGSYPAFYLSSFLPVKVLKGSAGNSGKGGSGMLRKALVILQFFIAIFMIIGTFVVSGQINFLKNKDLGFQKEDQVVMVLQDSTFRSKVQSFKKELMQNPNILSASNSTGVPGGIGWIQVMKVEQEEKMEDKTVILAQVDYDYLNTMQFELKEGRDFNEGMGTDAMEAVIVNEAAVKSFGWEGNALGKKIHYGFELDGTGGRMLKVIGVVKDFHFQSLHNTIEPIILFISEVPRYYFTCRINPESQKETLDYIEQKWNEFDAKRPFDFELLESSMDEMYKAEEKIGAIIQIASILTIFIALLGLLGLSSFIAEQKTKEVGVKKVLGASTGSILLSLYKEFALLILIAFIIAIPIAWWQLDIWLETNFVFHQPLQWTTFLLAGVTAFVIGMATISYYIMKAAALNPVDSIKYE